MSERSHKYRRTTCSSLVHTLRPHTLFTHAQTQAPVLSCGPVNAFLRTGGRRPPFPLGTAYICPSPGRQESRSREPTACTRCDTCACVWEQGCMWFTVEGWIGQHYGKIIEEIAARLIVTLPKIAGEEKRQLVSFQAYPFSCVIPMNPIQFYSIIYTTHQGSCSSPSLSAIPYCPSRGWGVPITQPQISRPRHGGRRAWPCT